MRLRPKKRRIMRLTYEELASRRFFLETGRDFSKLTPVEQRKLMEAEYDRVPKGDFSLVPRRNSGIRNFDIT